MQIKMKTLQATTLCGARSYDPYEELANAIIQQAVDDYRTLRNGRIPTITEETQLNLMPIVKINMINHQKQKIIDFFFSKRFSIYTKISPTWLLEKLDAEPITRWKPPAGKYVKINTKKLKEHIKKEKLSANELKIMTGETLGIYTRGKHLKNIITAIRLAKIEKGLGFEPGELVKEIL